MSRGYQVKTRLTSSDDQRHGLKELASLDLVTEGGKRGIDVSAPPVQIIDTIQFYHPKRYMTVTRPSGVDFIGEIEIEDGKAIHGECSILSTAPPLTDQSDATPSKAKPLSIHSTLAPDKKEAQSSRRGMN